MSRSTSSIGTQTPPSVRHHYDSLIASASHTSSASYAPVTSTAPNIDGTSASIVSSASLTDQLIKSPDDHDQWIDATKGTYEDTLAKYRCMRSDLEEAFACDPHHK